MSRYRKKKSHRLIVTIIILVVVLGAVCAGVTAAKVSSGSKPVNPDNGELVLVTIPMGSSRDTIGNILEENDMIKSRFAFNLKSKLKKVAYRAGSYELSQSMTLEEIMDKLARGDAAAVRFTIPEGYDLRRVAEKLEAEGFLTAEDFWYEVEFGEFDYDFIADLPSGENRLEGFLFPDTYEVYKNASAHDIIDRMLARFHQIFTEEDQARARELNMTVYEIMTLASIIEREAVVAEDRPIISSVFYNRMNVNMPLQSCATVQYILGENKPRLTISDTRIESPYNTYLIDGLPPGPIGAPGRSSIDAALYPADTDYIYFVAKGDGSHAFSVDYNQFLRDKAEYVK